MGACRPLQVQPVDGKSGTADQEAAAAVAECPSARVTGKVSTVDDFFRPAASDLGGPGRWWLRGCDRRIRHLVPRMKRLICQGVLLEGEEESGDVAELYPRRRSTGDEEGGDFHPHPELLHLFQAVEEGCSPRPHCIR